METVSGKVSSKERKLAGLLDRMKPGDSLIITEISRLSRTLLEIMTILNSCIKRGVVLYSTKEGYVFQNDINSKVLGFAFGLMAEIERNLIPCVPKKPWNDGGRRKTSGQEERGHTQNEDTLCEQEETCKGAPKRRVVCRTCPADGSVTDYDVPFSETLLSNSAKRRCQRLGFLLTRFVWATYSADTSFFSFHSFPRLCRFFSSNDSMIRKKPIIRNANEIMYTA